MISLKLPLVLAALALPGISAETEITGYLMDNLCINNCQERGMEGEACNPDGSNSFFSPETHTGWCLLLPPCVSSKYMLMSEDADADGMHSIVANFTDEASHEAVLDYINQVSDGKRVSAVCSHDVHMI